MLCVFCKCYKKKFKHNDDEEKRLSLFCYHVLKENIYFSFFFICPKHLQFSFKNFFKRIFTQNIVLGTYFLQLLFQLHWEMGEFLIYYSLWHLGEGFCKLASFLWKWTMCQFVQSVCNIQSIMGHLVKKNTVSPPQSNDCT